MWERALRRASLPVAYTSGFSPRPKLSFGLALPTGSESLAEYLDVEFEELDDSLSQDPGPQAVGSVAPLQANDVAARLDGNFPSGIHVTAAAELDGSGGSLQQDVTSCSWDIVVPEITASELGHRADRLMEATSLPVRRHRKGREVDDDLRPALISIAVCEPMESPATHDTGTSDACILKVDVQTRPRGVRPTELASVLGLELGCSRRTSQWIDCDGTRTEPLAPDASRPRYGLGDCVVNSSEREIPNVGHLGRGRGEHIYGTRRPGI